MGSAALSSGQRTAIHSAALSIVVNTNPPVDFRNAIGRWLRERAIVQQRNAIDPWRKYIDGA